MSIADRWTSGADYDQWMGRWSRLLAYQFLDWLSLPKGLHWIDICCGSGAITDAILERNFPAGVTGVDASSEQIAFAQQQHPGSKVNFQSGDAMDLPFADSSFDVAVCGLALNYIPKPLLGLQEFRRVTKPGGTIAAYLWDYEGGAQFLRAFWDAALAVDSEAAAFDQAKRFPVCTEHGLRRLFQEAQMNDTAVHPLEIVTRFTNFDDYWQPLLTGQGSAPNYLGTRDEKTKTAIREHLRAALPTGPAGTIELPARAWAIRGRT